MLFRSFLLYDTNEDRQIDKGEFLDLCHLAHYIHDQSLTLSRLEELKALFENFDADGNGQLNCEEFIQLCKQCTDVLQLIGPMFITTKWNTKHHIKVSWLV